MPPEVLDTCTIREALNDEDPVVFDDCTPARPDHSWSKLVLKQVDRGHELRTNGLRQLRCALEEVGHRSPVSRLGQHDLDSKGDYTKVVDGAAHQPGLGPIADQQHGRSKLRADWLLGDLDAARLMRPRWGAIASSVFR